MTATLLTLPALLQEPLLDLYDAKLVGAKLNRGNLVQASLLPADLTDADLTGANFNSAGLALAALHRYSGGLNKYARMMQLF